jgi:hypothetical protein
MQGVITMRYWWQSRSAVLVLGIAIGLVVGLNVRGLWPNVPLHATATHGSERFAIATGPVDGSVEAIYVLDYLTGDLRAVVINNLLGRFNAFFSYNIAGDFNVTDAKNPKFLMVTGLADVPRGYGRNIQTRSVVYIAEVSSGQVAAYAIPWNQTIQSARQVQTGSFLPIDKMNFRTAPIRD